MKDKRVLKKVMALLLTLVLVAGLVPRGGFTAYAANDFNDFAISSDGGVKASYDDAAKELTISGAGTIDYGLWKQMARKFNQNYFFEDDVRGWDGNTTEDFKIIFNGLAPKSIKLCGTGDKGGLFENFDEEIRFDTAVAIDSAARDLSCLFCRAPKFNFDISDWDVSHVTNMAVMFQGAETFSQSLNDWDVSHVTNMAAMFQGAEAFNKPLNDWDVSNVTNMKFMFAHADVFDQPLNAWDVSNVTDMDHMFNSAEAFNQPLDAWDVSNVTNMYLMFYGAAAFNQSIPFWNTAKVKDLGGFLKNASAFSGEVGLNISAADTINQAFQNTSASSIQLFNDGNGSGILVHRDFYPSGTLQYLEFSGFNGHNMPANTFTGDYTVKNVTDNMTDNRTVNQSYTFLPDRHYKVYLTGKKNIKACGVSPFPISDVVYTGSAIEPVVTVTDGAITLVKDADYKISYANNTEPGIASITITGKNGYSSERKIYFKIAKKQPLTFNDKNVAHPIDEASVITYDLATDLAALLPNDIGAITVRRAAIGGSNPAILAKGKDAPKISGMTLTYKMSGDGAVGDTAIVPLTISSEHYQDASFNLQIEALAATKKPIANCTFAGIPNQWYTGAALKPAVAVRDGAKTLFKGTDYTVSYQDNIAVGQAKAIVTGIGDYKGTKTLTFQIVMLPPPSKAISSCTFAAIPDQTHTGSPITPAVTIKDGAKTLLKGVDYTVSYQDNTAVGQAKVIVTGINDYQGVVEKLFSIVAAEAPSDDATGTDDDATGTDDDAAGTDDDAAGTDDDATGTDDGATGTDDDAVETDDDDDDDDDDDADTDDDDDADDNQSSQAPKDGEQPVVIKNPQLGETTSQQSSDGDAGKGFKDVQSGDWFAAAVADVVQKGLMNGVGNGLFDPNGETTRAMGVTLLYRLFGEPQVDSAHGFNDVVAGSWYCKPVNWAAREKLVLGFPDGSFKPNDMLTREQLVTILYRYAQYKQYDVSARSDLSGFSDAASVSPYAVEAMQWAVERGIIGGVGNKMLSPQGKATRAQLAAIVKRFEESH